MLGNLFFPTMSEFDDQVDQTLVPENHFVRKVARVVPWDEYQELLAPYYCQELGRPPIPPVVMLKLEYLRFHYNLSDRDVICRAQTDLAFRWSTKDKIRVKKLRKSNSLPPGRPPTHASISAVSQGRWGRNRDSRNSTEA